MWRYSLIRTMSMKIYLGEVVKPMTLKYTHRIDFYKVVDDQVVLFCQKHRLSPKANNTDLALCM